FSLDLETLGCSWLPLDKLRKVDRVGRTFYESPALIGCAFAVGRGLYDTLWGFDPAMQLWGVEDLDFSLKCWLAAHPVLHDPLAVIGHRFQDSFSTYRVSAVHILVNQMRTAYKHLSLSTWPEWLRLCRERHNDWSADRPEGLFSAAWHSFQSGFATAERERFYLQALRRYDDLWYAERFGLPWPTLARRSPRKSLPVLLQAFADPSPSPPPQCQIGSMQFLCDGVPADTYDPMYVFLGTTVTFQVVPANPQNPCPDASVSWGGTSGASGTGTSTSVRFGNVSASPTDYKTVTATCGNTVTVNVVVYDLSGTFTPDDNFQGRSTTQYGLDEEVELGFTTNPPGLTAAQIGRLKWIIQPGGVGTILATETGTADYDAGPVAGEVRLELELLDCPSDGLGATYVKDVIAPNGGYCVRVPGSGIWHCVNTFSIGLNSSFYLQPSTVSFAKLLFKEGRSIAQTTEWFNPIAGKVHQEWGSWYDVGNGNINTGCPVVLNFGDVAWLSNFTPPPYAAGTFLWAIPWLYSADGGNSAQQFATVNQSFSMTANGDATVQKDGAGPFGNNGADPSSNL
ncbi:MAG: hypothetical protein B7Z73_15250, partial [Planctomycetia bacterium 21-64-5]